jgi:arginine exporter protein ArgO
MLQIFKYFYFLGPPVALLVTWAIWKEFREVIHDDSEEPALVRRFLIIIALSLMIPPLILGTLQLLGGYDDPNFASAFSQEPFAFSAWVVSILFYLFMLVWIWFGNVAETVVLLRRKYERIPANLLLIRLVLSLFMVLGIVGVTAMPLLRPLE